LNSEQIHKVDKIFHKILWLDLFESQMLNDLVNAKLGIVLTKKQRKQLQARLTALENEENNADGADGGAAAVEEEAKPILFDLKLVGFDAKAKIKVIKVRCVYVYIFCPLATLPCWPWFSSRASVNNMETSAFSLTHPSVCPSLLQEVRGALELGLKEAKDMVEGAPVTLQKNMQPDVAAALKKKLEEAGATIELTEV
jgi:ribosomal protein L7/L12